MMMYPSELPSEYDSFGFNRAELLEFLSTEGIHISEASNTAPAAKKSEVPQWAKLSKAIKQFTLHEAADILIGFDPWHQGWRGEDGEREFSRACATLERAFKYGDLQPVLTDDHGHSSFNAQDLRVWAESVGLDWCIPSNGPEAANRTTTDTDAAHRLHQLEAENARLAEQVAELERRLAEVTAAPQEAPQIDADKLHPKRQASYETAIAALLDRLVTNGKWSSEASLIASIVETHKISKRTLEILFSEAKQRVAST